MQLRTFIAKDMREALGQVRNEMGPDAVIIASQRAKGGGIMVRAAFDAPIANCNDEPAAEAAPEPQVIMEPTPDFARSYHEGLIRRLRSEAPPTTPSTRGSTRTSASSCSRQ